MASVEVSVLSETMRVPSPICAVTSCPEQSKAFASRVLRAS